MAERLQSSIGIHRKTALELEEALEHILPGGAALAETEILVEHQLGRSEAVMHFRHAHLLARIGDARLRVSVACGGYDFGKSGEVILRRERSLGRSGHE